jgi:CRISPR-associated protein Cmr2
MPQLIVEGGVMSYLFLVTIGPVQEFIAGARRTRDLWLGSWLLSELSRAAALAVHAPQADRHLIFPDAGSDLADPERQIVNRVIVEVNAGPAADVLGHSVEAAIQSRLLAIREQAFSSQRVDWDEEFPELRELAERQVADLIEVFWVAAPIHSDYRAARNRLEDMMAARKATRLFGPAPATKLRGPKSSIDGSCESVIPEKLYPRREDLPEERERKANILFQRYRAGRAERLSGVDLLKRHGNRELVNSEAGNPADFPSTSHFAALPFLHRIAGDGRFESLREEYIRTLGRSGFKLERLAPRYIRGSGFGGYDASILFEERLVEEVDPSHLPAVQAALHAFYGQLSVGRPEPYYVLLHADGDTMGKVIDAQSDAGKHRELSASLERFASTVRRIVEEEHSGALVYAGGDDVLAFLPLHTALPCAKQLADAFRAALSGYVGEKGERATLSVGLAICHHIEPLSDALNLARAAEKAAKRLPGKNSLAITLSKRSGVDRTIGGSWQSGFFERLVELIQLHRSEAIPDGAAYDLRSLAERLSQGGNHPDPAMIRAEALRIVGRKRGLRGAAEKQNDRLVSIAQNLPSEESGTSLWSVTAFADELIVTREFARAYGAEPQEVR